MTALLDCVETETGPAPRASVVWLHGLGADGHDFGPIVPELRLPPSMPVRFVFPHAPVRPVTLNSGMAMRAWYDIYSLDRSAAVDEAGIKASRDHTVALIDREIQRGIAPERIVLAGFSQGGVIALYAGLRLPVRLAGILALSCYLPMAGSLAAEASDANRSTPVFQGHGIMDPVLPQVLGEEARDVLTANGYDTEWHSYPMAHAVCPQEISDISRWLQRRLA